MEIESWVILVIAGAPFVVLATILVISALIGGSQETRREERQKGRLQ